MYNECRLLFDRFVYAGDNISEDIFYTKSLQFIQLLAELSKVVQGDFEWTEADLFMHYFKKQGYWYT